MTIASTLGLSSSDEFSLRMKKDSGPTLAKIILNSFSSPGQIVAIFPVNWKRVQDILAEMGTTCLLHPQRELFRWSSYLMSRLMVILSRGIHNVEKDVEELRVPSKDYPISVWGTTPVVRFGVDGYMRQEAEVQTGNWRRAPWWMHLGAASINHARSNRSGTPSNQDRWRSHFSGEYFRPQDPLSIQPPNSHDQEGDRPDDIIPRLWISGFNSHRRVFTIADCLRIFVSRYRKEIEEWEVDNAENLRQLASLLHDWFHVARTSRTHLEICRSKSGALEIRRLAV